MVTAIIISGAVLMVWNVCRFFQFMKNTQDVLSSDSTVDMRWENIAFLLLVFFLGAYVFVGISSHADLLTALILFFGSVFVAIVRTLLVHLLNTTKERSIDVAEVLVGVIDARDPNLNGHSRYVQEVTMLFYRYLPAGMKKEINPVSLEYAALMHDVGKLGVPESILNKPAKLDDEEWKVMRNHPRTGVKILRPLHSFENIFPWIEYHHERPDGQGYYGLKGDEIPLAARIISIADTYSAITMRRSYKAPRTHEEAVQILREVAGTQLDQNLVNIFLTIPKEELERCMPETVKY